MRYGTLTYDFEQSRFDISLDGGGRLGGFHCGDILEIRINKQWIPTRMEHNGSDWILMGIKDEDWHIGQKVRLA